MANYSKAKFDPRHDSADFGAETSLEKRFERVRRSTVQALQDSSRTGRQHAETEELLEVLFLEKLDKLLKRERQTGKRLLPEAGEIKQMSLEKIMEHFDKSVEL